jgi:Na+-translocating ferredoxin:NAD+ oxidoreductase RnfG subunit
MAAASDREDIERTFDKHKGKIYAVYLRELKEHPGLKGKLVLDLRIATDGRVASCRVLSSTLASPGIGDKVCEKTREFQFAPRAEAASYTKRIDFFPAS